MVASLEKPAAIPFLFWICLSWRPPCGHRGGCVTFSIAPGAMPQASLLLQPQPWLGCTFWPPIALIALSFQKPALICDLDVDLATPRCPEPANTPGLATLSFQEKGYTHPTAARSINAQRSNGERELKGKRTSRSKAAQEHFACDPSGEAPQLFASRMSNKQK